MQARVALVAMAWLCLPAATTWAQKLYRWVDDQGVVHYGDRVPPEFADRDRDILNDQAVEVGFEEGAVSEAERTALDEQRAAEAAAAAARAEVARRDRMLLQTYLTVADIEDLRDRRLELLDSQIKVTEAYLANLRERLAGLQAEAAVYKPYSEREEARQIPAELAHDISRTIASITLYEETLARRRVEQTSLKAAFDSDIARFRELKGG